VIRQRLQDTVTAGRATPSHEDLDALSRGKEDLVSLDRALEQPAVTAHLQEGMPRQREPIVAGDGGVDHPPALYFPTAYGNRRPDLPIHEHHVAFGSLFPRVRDDERAPGAHADIRQEEEPLRESGWQWIGGSSDDDGPVQASQDLPAGVAARVGVVPV